MQTIIIIAIVSWIVSGLTIAYPDQVKAGRNKVLKSITKLFERKK